MIYKILAKVLANRLKNVLSKLVSETQYAFVSGQSIMDNVLVAYEVIHFMWRRMSGCKGNVALKVDINKA